MTDRLSSTVATLPAPSAPDNARSAATASAAWDEARNILCVRLDNMGDVLMTTPALRALKDARPDRRLTLLASRAGAAIAAHVPEVDETIVYEAAWVKNAASPPDTYRATVERLRGGGFDAAVIFTVYSQSALPAALMCHAAGIPRVLAYSRENPYHLVSDWVREVEPLPEPRHEVQRQLDLVATVGASTPDTRLSFRVADADGHALDAILRARGIALPQGWVLAHCGATAESRRYPATLFAQAIDMLAGAGVCVMLTGSPDERALVDEVVARSCDPDRLVNLAGALTLGQFGALVARAGLLVSNNSGPVHIAAALGTPVVDLYALTNPQHTPWQVPHRLLYRDVPCKYCYRSVCPLGHHACLSAVDPAQVAQAAFELLESQAPARQPIMIEAA
ncbi:glycosyltransferase family 9 protein [Bordetella genomosp. 11]|uniref:Glycosyl transferase n=1 Tax=Bordetella genomosp. 11 TaxID=1416808 RepID=A0A261UKW9_9BORD|nr:glycosyltransferase family 9 protein [Bordetella genomosp. 11]OZI62281.1 glycosyl transferase [Bordetella genomosp. 11]